MHEDFSWRLAQRQPVSPAEIRCFDQADRKLRSSTTWKFEMGGLVSCATFGEMMTACALRRGNDTQHGHLLSKAEELSISQLVQSSLDSKQDLRRFDAALEYACSTKGCTGMTDYVNFLSTTVREATRRHMRREPTGRQRLPAGLFAVGDKITLTSARK